MSLTATNILHDVMSVILSHGGGSVTARLQERVQGLEQELKRNRVRCALLKTALHQKRQVLTLAMQHLEPDGSSAFRAKLARSDIGDHIVNFCRVNRCTPYWPFGFGEMRKRSYAKPSLVQ